MPNETNSNPIADALVLVFSTGTSLVSWKQSGLFPREWRLYEGLRPSFRKIVIVTADAHTQAENQAVLASSPCGFDPDHHIIVTGNNSPAGTPDAPRLAASVTAALAGCRSAVVKTPIAHGGEVGLEIARSLRAAGLSVGLLARGGFLWSKFVAHEHGPHSLAHNEVAAIEGRLCQTADLVVGTTQDMIEDLAWRYHLPPGKGRVIPNYVLSEDEVTPASDREPSTILYAGPLMARKRVDLLIEAVALLSEQRRATVVLELLGSGPEQSRLESLARERNVTARFPGRLPHNAMLERMGRATLYAQCSELEGHPRGVIEAMASGCSVIVVDAPGLADIVTHGVSGLRVAPDPQALAHAIDGLLEDPDWRDTLGATASRVARASYALPIILEREIEASRLALRIGSAATTAATTAEKAA
jgi:glycosyltransferase involved in cell wall biosynthesis